MKRLYSIFFKEYVLLTGLFFLIALLGILNHEIWLDEAQHWLLARDSSSFSDLIQKTRYEGHPILWNMLLFVITRFTPDPFYMQLLHLVISSTAVLVFLKHAPFNRVMKILFIFGYFMLFEYTLISRNYSLGVLFLFLACSVYKDRQERFILFSLLLALGCNTHAIFFVIACCLMLVVFIEHLRRKGISMSGRFISGMALFAIGALLAVMQMIPPSDTGFFDGISNFSIYDRITKSFAGFFKGIVVLPDFGEIHFWNSNLIIATSKILAACLALLALCIPYFLFFRNKTTLVYTYLGILAGMLLFYVTQISGTRYFGMFYILLFTALWIDHYYPNVKSKWQLPLSEQLKEKLKNGILYSILGIHLLSGIWAYGMDLTKPFTNADQVVAFLKESELFDKVVVTKACDGTPLSAYLERKIYFASYGGYQSYCIWGNPERNVFSKRATTISSLETLVNTQQESIIFVSFDPFFKINTSKGWTAVNENIKYRFLQKFEESIVRKGKYYVYEIAPH